MKGNETKDLSKGKQWIECRETMEKQRETIDESESSNKENEENQWIEVRETKTRISVKGNSGLK